MIELFFWTTPNGMKPLIMLEETGLDHTIQLVNISRGEHLSQSFRRISANQKIPAIVDHAPLDGNTAIPIFESGAILQYLAERSGSLLPQTPSGRAQVLQWLYWQMAGLGPTLGQFMHFSVYASEPVPYAQGRFSQEKERLFGVLNGQLAGRDFIAGDYSIADVAVYPWIRRLEREGSHLEGHCNLNRWYQTVSDRPAVKRAYARADDINTTPSITTASRRFLIGSAAAA
ncbi:MAG: thiol:disulfide oxidoreductase [Rhizobiales bacterium]|nr:thiol:disulfide oxidoreductase [Hyphomicrobiales bacterium]